MWYWSLADFSLFFCQHPENTHVCSRCSPQSSQSSSPHVAEFCHTWVSHTMRSISRGCTCGCRCQGPTLHQIPQSAEHGACKTLGTSAWQACLCIVQMCASSLETPTFFLPVLRVKCCYCVHRVALAAARVQVLPYVFIYLLLVPFLAALVLAIRNVPATCKSKGAESCGTKQHLAESNASSGS